MKISIEIDTDNAAWVDNGINETNRVMCRAMDIINMSLIDGKPDKRKLLDSYGNTTGEIMITKEVKEQEDGSLS